MKKILIASIICLSLIMAGCSNSSGSSGSSPSNSSTSSSSTSTTDTTASTSKDMTVTELKKYNGQNGNPAYVAVSGVVYDVTNAKEWKNGKHKGGATAGNDLTKMIEDSPHGKDVLKGLPVIGKLK